MQRLETWGHVFKELKKRLSLNCVHFVEPRYEQVHSPEGRTRVWPTISVERERDELTCLVLESWAMASVDVWI